MSDHLTSGQWMSNDAPLVSADGRYAAYLQSDANLVLCHTINGIPDLKRPYWSVFANAAGQVHGQHTGPSYWAGMQGDGNFVLYNGKGPSVPSTPYWATNTNRASGQYTAVIQNDGNFVVYAGNSPIWASNTNRVSTGVMSGDRLTSMAQAAGSAEYQWISPTNALISADGRFAAYLQTDGNLILCHTANGAPDPSQPYWSVFANAGGAHNRLGGAPYCAIMQMDGNFVLYNGTRTSQGAPYWASNTVGTSGLYTAIIQTDGNFVVYSGTPSGRPDLPSIGASWASHTANWPPPPPAQDPSWYS